MKKNTVKDLMKAGIIRLAGKKKLIDVTVTDLIKEAGVARASFYRIYNNVDQVVDDVIKDVHDAFMNRSYKILMSGDETEIKKMITNYFHAVKEKRSVLFEILPENYSLFVGKLEKISTATNDYQPDGSLYQKYVPGLCLVNVLAIVKIWKKHGYKETPEELADFTYQIIGKKYMQI